MEVELLALDVAVELVALFIMLVLVEFDAIAEVAVEFCAAVLALDVWLAPLDETGPAEL